MSDHAKELGGLLPYYLPLTQSVAEAFVSYGTSLDNLVRELHQLRANDVKQWRTEKQTQIDRSVLDHAKIEGSRPRKPFIKKIVAETDAPVHTVRDRVRILCDKVGQ